MAKKGCINKSSAEFKTLLRNFNGSATVLEHRIVAWQSRNKKSIEDLPSVAEVLIGVTDPFKIINTANTTNDQLSSADVKKLLIQRNKTLRYNAVRFATGRDGIKRLYITKNPNSYKDTLNALNALKRKYNNLDGVEIHKAPKAEPKTNRPVYYIKFTDKFEQTKLFFNVTGTQVKSMLSMSDIKNSLQFEGTMIEFLDEIPSTRGIKVAMRNVNKGEKIQIVAAQMRKKYEDKAWTTPAPLADGSRAVALPEDVFKSFEEFLTFALLHEKAHETLDKGTDETIGAYETRVTKEALSRLQGIRVAERVRESANAPKMTLKKAEQLQEILTQFAEINGIRVEGLSEVVNVLKKQGRIKSDAAGVAGVADAMNKIVGIDSSLTLPEQVEILGEEIGHIAIAMLGLNHELVAPLLEVIEATEEYKQDYATYFEAYKRELGLDDSEADAHSKIEILGKILTNELLKDPADAPSSTRSLIMRIWDKITALFGTPNSFYLQSRVRETMGALATKIRSGERLEEVSDPYNNPSSVFFHLEKASLEAFKEKLGDDIIADLNNQVRVINESIGRGAKTDLQGKRLEQKRDEIIKDLADKQTAKGLLNYMQYLDGVIQEFSKDSESMKSNGSSLDIDKINTGVKFLSAHEDMIAEIGLNLQRIVDSEETNLSEEELAELNSLITNATRSIGNLSNIYKDLDLHAYDQILSSELDYYEPGDIVKILKAEAGTDLLSYTGKIRSLRKTDNKLLLAAYKILKRIDNEKNSVGEEVEAKLQRLYEESERAGFDFDSMFEKDSKGNLTGNVVSKYNQGKLQQAREEVLESLVKTFASDGITDYNDLRLKIELIKEKEESEQSTEEKAMLDKYIKVWSNFNKKYYDVSGYKTIRNLGKADLEILERTYVGTTITNSNSKDFKVGDKVNFYTEKNYPSRKFGKVVEVGEKANDKTKYKIEIIDNTEEGLSDILLNKTYDSIKDNAYYKEYINTMATYKENLPFRQRTGDKKFMMPQVGASKAELVRDGRYNSLKEKVKQGVLRYGDDDTYGAEVTNYRGIKNKFIPVYYTNKIDPKILSKDLTASMIKFAKMSTGYKEAVNSRSELEALQRAVARQEFKTKKGTKADITGEATKTYELLENFLNIYLFGESEESMTAKILGKEVQVDKILKGLYNFVQKSNLAFSLPIALSGFIKGNIDQVIERIGGRLIAKDSIGYSQAEAVKNLPGIMNDVGKRLKTNKLSLIMKYVGTGFDNEAELLRFKAKGARITLDDLAYAPYSVLDGTRQATLTIAIADNLRYIDGKLYLKEEYLAQKGATEEIWKANRSNSLYNKIKIKDGVVSGVDKKDLFRFRDIVAELSPRLKGEQGSLDKNNFNRNALSRFAGMHRGWLINGIEHRFHRRHTSPLTGLTEEGTYRTVGSLLTDKELYSAIRAAAQGNPALLKTFWKDLKPYQKINILRVSADLGALSVLSILGAAVNAIASEDDDDMWWLQYSAYQTSRVLLEQRAFWSPFTLMEVLKSPAAGINVVESFADLQWMLNWDDLERGQYKGMTRFEKQLIRSVYAKNLYELGSPQIKNSYLESMVLEKGLNPIYGTTYFIFSEEDK